MIKVYTFVVSGYNSFPLDMLRYDKCWPQTPDGVDNLTIDLASSILKAQTVKLCSHFHPTVERWESFGWTVKGITKGKI